MDAYIKCNNNATQSHAVRHPLRIRHCPCQARRTSAAEAMRAHSCTTASMSASPGRRQGRMWPPALPTRCCSPRQRWLPGSCVWETRALCCCWRCSPGATAAPAPERARPLLLRLLPQLHCWRRLLPCLVLLLLPGPRLRQQRQPPPPLPGVPAAPAATAPAASCRLPLSGPPLRQDG